MFTEIEVQFLIDNYINIGIGECVRLLNKSKQSIYKEVKKLGLKSIIRDIKYKVDFKKFMLCDSKEVVYLLGFLWADGNLNYNEKNNKYTISMELARPDFDIVRDIALLTGGWNITYRCRKNRKPQGRLITGQRPLYEYLASKDYETKSVSSADKILETIPEHLKHYWWRGYFDGDGCFYYNKQYNLKHMIIGGNYKQDWKFVRDLLNNLNIKFSETKRKQTHSNNKISRHSVVRVVNKGDIEKFVSYIYKDYDNMGLGRKYDKYIKICNI